jgi:hypothetical protein
MNKKLPNLYVNKIEKVIDNNERVFYSALKPEVVVENVSELPIDDENQSVGDKVDELFNSPNYVYKMHATITLKDKTVMSKDIIGQMEGKLITIDEDLIDIDDIRDIKF